MTESIRQILISSPSLLSDASTSPKLDIELLLSEVLKVSREYLHTWPDQRLTDEQLLKFQHLLQQRQHGKPIAYILGKQAFWSLTLKVNAATLIPRPETELLIDIILQRFASIKNLSVLDLGTGSGAIALALATEQPTWQITAVDCSFDALSAAQENANYYGITSVAFIQSNWYSNLGNRKYDIIVSNPPYIAENDPALHQQVLQYEPKTALISKQAGFADIIEIISEAKYFLKKNGFIVLEHGYQQSRQVNNILKQCDYKNIQCHPDLSGIVRAVSALPTISRDFS